jgi:hypothetical protein
MKKIMGYGAVLALVMLAGSCGSSGAAKTEPPPPAPAEPVKATEAYVIPVSQFAPWYKASIEEDTIAFEGGGLDCLLPEGVDLKAYSQLVLVYETSDWVDEEAVAAKTGKPNTMQLSIKDWDGGEARVDLTYPYLEEGSGEAVLLEGENYAALQKEGVAGFTLAANVWENNGIANYKLKIVSLELRP